jgi:carboxypeptidase C (cathepsin A)
MTNEQNPTDTIECITCYQKLPLGFYYLGENGKPMKKCKKCRNRAAKAYVKGTGRFTKDSTYAAALKKQMQLNPDLEYEVRTYRPNMYNRLMQQD